MTGCATREGRIQIRPLGRSARGETGQHRRRLVLAILEVWCVNPESRFGQLLYRMAAEAGNQDLFDIEDAALLAKAEKMRSEGKKP